MNVAYYIIAPLITGIITGLLAFFVLWKKKNSDLGRAFFLTSISVSLYNLFYSAFPLLMFSREYSLMIFKLISAPVVFIPSAFFHFVIIFTNNKKKYKKIIWVFYSLSFFLLFSINSSFFIKEMVPKFSWPYWAVPGIAHHLLVTFLFASFLWASYLLYKDFLISDLEKKAQIRLFFMALTIALFSGSANFFYWYNINIPPVTMPFMVFFPALMAYAIIAHRLFDIKIVLRRSVVYALSVITVSGLLLPLKVISVKFFNDIVSLTDFFFLLLALGIYQPIKERYYDFANKYFFTSLYDGNELISGLNKSLRSTLNSEEIYKIVYETLNNYLHTTNILFLNFAKEDHSFDAKFNTGINFGKNKKSFFSKLFMVRHINRGIIININDLNEIENEKEYNDDVHLLKKTNAVIMVPLLFQKRIIGVMMIGEKETKERFNSDDIMVLEVISGLIATSLENAYLYKDLKKQKDDLEELLDIKTKFLRIINHQLNTPLSKIKMGIYGMEEKMFSSKKAMDTIKDGAEQMSNFLTDYWNSFEFEGGKSKKMNITSLDIYKLIKEVVNEKKSWDFFKKSKLKIKLKKPSYKTIVEGDSVFIRRVIAILIENAIYYTKEGGLNIYFEKRIKKEKNYIKVFFEDTGIGISRESAKALFDKFSRGEGASNYYPDGAGLDLYLSKKIIEANGGELKLEKSVIGQGSIFSFSLLSK